MSEHCGTGDFCGSSYPVIGVFEEKGYGIVSNEFIEDEEKRIVVMKKPDDSSKIALIFNLSGGSAELDQIGIENEGEIRYVRPRIKTSYVITSLVKAYEGLNDPVQ
ncbi:MAG: hypothetical protein KAJ91_04555 [Candidatus Aenigmarchaeota archaeon]|nr:hypothetical protein [Candidatus Aenigmarchaeota archaeon]